MNTKIYQILCEKDGMFIPFDNIEYTEDEANKEIRRLRRKSEIKFKLKFLRKQDMVTLTLKPYRGC